MFSKVRKAHPEICEDYCTRVAHGNLITASLTKTDVSDEALIYYMFSVCPHFATARDSAGRSALHVAASCGKSSLVNWIVTHRNGKLEDKDQESGYTPLHRSLFYGKINTAVTLIKLGSNVNALDEESLSPLEHVMKDVTCFNRPKTRVCMSRKAPYSNQVYPDYWIQNGFDSTGFQNISGELYAWGANCNYTLLGTASPDFAELSHFHKEYPDKRIKTIHLSKYHCMVTSGSKIYAWGHGQGGRLGLNKDSTVLNPEMVPIELKNNVHSVHGVQLPNIQHMCIARDHSIFLDVKSNVWTCGLNEHSLLGVEINESSKSLIPVCVQSLKNKEIIGVACGTYHSVAYSVDVMYTWGLNGGQLGHSFDCKSHVKTPRKISRLLDGVDGYILQVCCSEGCIGVLTSGNAIYLLHEYQRHRIVLKSTAPFRNLQIYGGKLDSRTKIPFPHQELHAAVSTRDNDLLLWRESDPHLRQCVFTLQRPLLVHNVVLNAFGCIFTTIDHEVFLGVIKRRKGAGVKLEKDKDKKRELGKSAFHKFLEKDECVMVEVKKVPRIHRALYVTCDPDGDNFIVLQNNRYEGLPNDIPQSNSPVGLEQHLQALWQESCDEDSLCDFKFVVENRTFYCHKYIIASASANLSDIVRQEKDNTHIVKSVTADTFEEMLQYIYIARNKLLNLQKFCFAVENTNNSLKFSDRMHEHIDDNFERIKTIFQTAEFKDSGEHITPQMALYLCAQKFGLERLQERLEHFLVHKFCDFSCCILSLNGQPIIGYERLPLIDISDVEIICKNGDKIRAHKCMLMRLDYFRNLFSARWTQAQNTITIDYPQLQVEMLLDFIYTNQLFHDLCNMDTLLSLLVLSDEFIVETLRNLCEFRLCKYINLKTVVNLYHCSLLYGDWYLKKSCSHFIIANLAELLESRSLDSIEEAHLVDISRIFVQYNSGIFSKRFITPFSYIPDIEEPPSYFDLKTLESDKYLAIEAQKAAKKRIRRYKNSSGGESVLDFTDGNMEILEIESTPNDCMNIYTPAKPSSRFLAITLASEKLNESSETDNDFVSLSTLKLSNNSFGESDYPDLNCRNLSSGSLHSKSPGKSTDFKKMPKLSQKARKRLQSEGSGSPSISEPQSPTTNPWKVMEMEASVSAISDANQDDMSAIIKTERMQKENLKKMRNRLFSSMQIVDKAILDLEKFYNADNIEDELIEVQRLASDNVAQPIWVPKTKRSEN